jgi:hypothetical protein
MDKAVREFAKQPPSSSPLVSRQAPARTQSISKTSQPAVPKMSNPRPMQTPANRARSQQQQQQQSGSSHASAITLD